MIVGVVNCSEDKSVLDEGQGTTVDSDGAVWGEIGCLDNGVVIWWVWWDTVG